MIFLITVRVKNAPILYNEQQDGVKFISIGYELCNFFFRSQMQTLTLDDLNEQVVLSLLTDIVDKLQKENQKLRIKQAQIQVGL